MLDTTSGITSRFSWLYRPGATKAHNWYSTIGSATMKAASSVIFNGTMKGEMTLVAISVVPLGSEATSGAAIRSYMPAGPRPDAEHGESDADRNDDADQAVAQLDEVRDERLLGAGEFVFLVGRVHLPSGRGLKRATRAAPDSAWVRMPWRCLYQAGIAPRFRRQFFFGCL